MNQLEQLKKHTLVVCDSGDIDAIAKYAPTDATTNPSLIFQAASLPQYKKHVDAAVEYVKSKHPGAPLKDVVHQVIDKLTVVFGCEILKLIPGYCSTEVDARLSFDTEASVAKARELIKLYQEAGINKDRILIKLASTYEGIMAAKILEEEGIRCNLTLMFSMAQAIGAAEVNATLVSPFVGRILDWYKKAEGKESYPAEQDPGCVSVKEIFTYYKKHGYKTIVMGASFRNKEEIVELCGCDRLTIAPKFLGELEASTEPITVKLVAEDAKQSSVEKIPFNEKSFRWMLNENQMATEKLSEGVRLFTKDIIKLEEFILKNWS